MQLGKHNTCSSRTLYHSKDHLGSKIQIFHSYHNTNDLPIQNIAEHLEKSATLQKGKLSGIQLPLVEYWLLHSH